MGKTKTKTEPKTEPKELKVGDRVKVVDVQPGCEGSQGMGRYLGETGTITKILASGMCSISCDCGVFFWAPDWLEACEESEAKELNLLEILKGCDGMMIYSPMFGDADVHLEEGEEGYPLEAYGMTFTADGRYIAVDEALPMLFPSRELYEKYPLDAYAAWMEWQEVKASTISINCAGANFEAGLSFGSIADRDACLEEISAIIEKYSKNA